MPRRLPARPRPATSTRAFTLVELMVVVGIIVVLLGLLMPTLGNIREATRVAGCLSNLRQLGSSVMSYAAANDRYLVPCDYGDPVTAPDANGYKTLESWATILVTQKYIEYPSASSTATSPPVDGGVLRCPSGSNDFMGATSVTNRQPPTRTSALGAMGLQHSSRFFEPGRKVYSWYGINGTSSNHSYIPCRRWPPDGQKDGPLNRLQDIRKPGQLAFLFDGLAINYHTVNANRINARHKNRTATNILFFDGHAETFPTRGLPGGIGDAGVGSAAQSTFSPTNLRNFSHPLWRMDQ